MRRTKLSAHLSAQPITTSEVSIKYLQLWPLTTNSCLSQRDRQMDIMSEDDEQAALHHLTTCCP